MKSLTLGIGAAAIAFIARDFSQWMQAGMKRHPRKECIRKDKAVRDNLSNKQIDKTIQDSFPASDPPSYY